MLQKLLAFKMQKIDPVHPVDVRNRQFQTEIWSKVDDMTQNYLLPFSKALSLQVIYYSPSMTLAF